MVEIQRLSANREKNLTRNREACLKKYTLFFCYSVHEPIFTPPFFISKLLYASSLPPSSVRSNLKSKEMAVLTHQPIYFNEV